VSEEPKATPEEKHDDGDGTVGFIFAIILLLVFLFGFVGCQITVVPG